MRGAIGEDLHRLAFDMIEPRQHRGRRAAVGEPSVDEERAVFVVFVGRVELVGEVFDMAGRSSSGNLATRLETRFGRASRIMWPAYERNQGQVERDADVFPHVARKGNVSAILPPLERLLWK